MAPKLHGLLPEGERLFANLLLVCVIGVVYPMYIDLLWPDKHLFCEARNSFIVLISHPICLHAVLHLVSYVSFLLECLGFLFLQP